MLALLWYTQTHHFEAFRFDDAYITLRYASNLALHGHPSFNLDDRVDGFTSPGWMLLLAVAIRIGVDGEVAALALGKLVGLFAVFGGILLSLRLGAHRAIALGVAGIGIVTTPGFVLWSTPGADMPLAAFAAVGVLLAYAELTTRSSWLARGLKIAALTLAGAARPELLLLVGTLLLADVVSALRATPGEKWTTAAPALCVIAVFTFGFFAHWAYYGYPLPNTYYAKTGGGPLMRRGILDLLTFSGQRIFWLTPPAIILLLLRSRRDVLLRAVIAAFAVWSVGTCVVYARSGGDWIGFHRYYQPLVPASFAMIAAALGTALRMIPRCRSTAMAVTGVLCAIALWMVDRHVFRHGFARDVGGIRSHSQSVAAWRRAALALRRTFPASTSMSIRAAGIIPYVTRFKSYDTLALNNKAVAHSTRIIRWVPGHQKEATAAQIVAWSPDIIVNHPVITGSDLTSRPPRWFAPSEFPSAGYHFRCIRSVPGEFVCLWMKARSSAAGRKPVSTHVG